MKRKFFILLSTFFILGAGWFGRDWLMKFPLFSSLFGGFKQESVVTTSGLVAYYPMERNGATLSDYSRSNNDGTITGATSVPGRKGTALDFDGADDTVPTAMTSNTAFTNGFTISAWIKPDSAGEHPGVESVAGGRIVDKTSDIYASNGFTYYTAYSDNTLAFIGNDGSRRVSADISAYYGHWIFVTVTVASNATVTHYINGAVSGTPGTTNALSGITTANALTIGNRSTATDRTFDGTIDEVRIYDRVLTAEKISQLYRDGNQTIGGGDKGLIAHYPLDQENQVFQGTNSLSGLNFASGWTPGNVTVNSANQFTGNCCGGGGIYRYSFDVGSRYSLIVTGTYTGSFKMYNNSSTSNLLYTGSGGVISAELNFAAVDNYLNLATETTDGVVVITSVTLQKEQTSDATPNARHGTINAGSGGYTTDQHGQANKAYNFDGSATQIDLGSAWDIGTVHTISFWMDYEDAGDGEPIGGASTGNQYAAYVSGPGAAATISYYPGDVYVTSDAMGPFASGVWNLITIVRNGTSVTFYKNGVQAGSTKTLGANTAMNLRFFGKEGTTSTYYFQGKLSDIRIYNRVLSATEVRKLYDAYDPKVSINGLAKGLIGHWELTQKWSNGTTIHDLTPNNRTGTATSVTVGGRASDFDGDTSLINAGSDFIGTTSTVTVAAWIYPENAGEFNTGAILSNGNYYFSLNNFNGLYGTSDQAGANDPAYKNSIITFNTWQHVVATRSGTTWSFYVNRSSKGADDSAGGTPTAGTTNVGIGNKIDTTRGFDGRIADLRVYNRVLSTTEITQLYNMGRPRASDRATDLNGTTQYFTLADGASAGDDMEPGTSDFLLEAWVDADAFAANQILVGKSSDITGATSLYGMYLNTSGRLVGKIADADSATTSTDDGTALTANKWYHLAIAFDRDGNMTRYVDGTAYGTADSIANEAASLTNAVAFSVGGESDGGLPLNGQVDGVRVYKFTSGLPTNLSQIMSYNAEEKGPVHPDIAGSLVDGWDFDGEGWARTTWSHNLTNNGTTTFVKP